MQKSGNKIKIDQVRTKSNRYKYTIQDLNKYAISKNGACLEPYYRGNKHKNRFKCSKGHMFFARWNDILCKNSWCTVCWRINSAKRIKKFISPNAKKSRIYPHDLIKKINSELSSKKRCSHKAVKTFSEENGIKYSTLSTMISRFRRLKREKQN